MRSTFFPYRFGQCIYSNYATLVDFLNYAVKDKVWHCCALSMDRAGTEQKALDEIFKHGEKPLKEHLKRESAPWKL